MYSEILGHLLREGGWGHIPIRAGRSFANNLWHRSRKSVFRDSGPPASGERMETYTNTCGKAFREQSFQRSRKLFFRNSGEILSEQKRLVSTYENVVSLGFLIDLLEGQQVNIYVGCAE